MYEKSVTTNSKVDVLCISFSAVHHLYADYTECLAYPFADLLNLYALDSWHDGRFMEIIRFLASICKKLFFEQPVYLFLEYSMEFMNIAEYRAMEQSLWCSSFAVVDTYVHKRELCSPLVDIS